MEGVTSNDKITDKHPATLPMARFVMGPLSAPIPRYYFEQPKQWWARISDGYRNLPISALWAAVAAAVMLVAVSMVLFFAPVHRARLGEYARATTENPLAVRAFIFEREWPVAPPFLEIDDKVSTEGLELLVSVNLEYMANMTAAAALANQTAPVCVFPSAYTHPWALVSTHKHATYVNPIWTGIGGMTIVMMTSLTGGNSSRIAFLYDEISLVWKYVYRLNGEGRPYLADYGGEAAATRLGGTPEDVALAHCIQTYYIK